MPDVWVLMAWSAVALVGYAGCMTVVNMWTWPRARRSRRSPAAVSVLIPARDEAENIRACVEAVLPQLRPADELLVLDDGSTDATPDILSALAGEHPQLRVLRGRELPEGWIGKPHACHRLGLEARGDCLVFVDADVRLDRGALGRISSLMQRHRASVMTLMPVQLTASWLEHLVVPFLHLTYAAWFPLVLVHRSRDPRFLAANGQVLCVSREAYERVGGFAAVRHEVVDDMAFCRRAKTFGERVVFADGDGIARCRMYRSAPEVIEGFSKNLYEGVGSSPTGLLAVAAVYLLAFVVPYIALAAAPFHAGLWLPAVLGVALNLGIRSLLAWRYRHHAAGVVLHPVGVLVLLGVAWNSWRWACRDTVRWAGRTYASRAARRPTEVSAHEVSA